MRNSISYGRCLIVLFLAVVCLSPTAALASNRGIEVPCRVDSNTIALTVTPGAVDYGVVALGTAQDTTATGVNATQTVTNTSDTETVNFRIKSSNAIAVPAFPANDWTLAASVGVLDEFTHKASLDNGSTWPVAMIADDTYVDLIDSVAPTVTVDFDLQLGMPTTATDDGAHTITVTILAEAGGG